MEFQEYPKALYRKGEYIAVADAAEEEAQRTEGFTDWLADHTAMQAPAAPADAPADDATLDRDALKARATELGIDFAKNISTAKLAELVAAACGE